MILNCLKELRFGKQFWQDCKAGLQSGVGVMGKVGTVYIMFASGVFNRSEFLKLLKDWHVVLLFCVVCLLYLSFILCGLAFGKFFGAERDRISILVASQMNNTSLGLTLAASMPSEASVIMVVAKVVWCFTVMLLNRSVGFATKR